MGSSQQKPEVRQMIVRYADTKPATITEFGCSICPWTFQIQNPAPGPLRAELLEFAENAYDLHACPGQNEAETHKNQKAAADPSSCLQGTQAVH
jgi:hypothetical protein